MAGTYKDWTGHKFGNLLVLEPTDERYLKKKVYWLCQCDCGNKVVVLSTSLTTNHTTSCGCIKRDHPARLRHGHGRTGRRSRTYQTWVGMRTRNEYDPRWDVFENFLADMGEAPEGMTLDRIDNSRGYFKDNCRWATVTQQNRNRTNTKWLTYKGEKLPIAEWAERYSLPYDTLYFRLYKGWTPEKALETPLGKRTVRLVA